MAINDKLKFLLKVLMAEDLLEVVEGGAEAWEVVAEGASLKVKVVWAEVAEEDGHKAKMVWVEVTEVAGHKLKVVWVEVTEVAGHKVKMVWVGVTGVAGHKMKVVQEVEGEAGNKAEAMVQVEGEEEAEADGLMLTVRGDVDEEVGHIRKGKVQVRTIGAVMGGIESPTQEKQQQQTPMIGGRQEAIKTLHKKRGAVGTAGVQKTVVVKRKQEQGGMDGQPAAVRLKLGVGGIPLTIGRRPPKKLQLRI